MSDSKMLFKAFVCDAGFQSPYAQLETHKALTLIRGFLGPSPSVISEKKSKITTGDVTVKTNEIKIICADRLSVGLYYGANFKWHMPI